MRNLILLIACGLFLSCSENYTPKPYGHVRINLPDEHKMKTLSQEESCAFNIKVSEYSIPINRKEACWYNIVYPQHKAVIHLTYKPIENNLAQLVEDSRSLVMNHSVKADGLDEQIYINDSLKVYGMFYELLGNAANYLQFYVTDSTDHYLRGALYFNIPPNRDSLQPVIDWMKEDMRLMIESVNWN